MSGFPSELNSRLVRAGAGAGKTTGLVNQVRAVYDAYMRGTGRAPRIVITTFTRKATQELKERLILRACDERDPDFLQFVSDPLKLHISTIHGLLSVFLKQVGHLAGLDAGFGLMSEGEARHLARLALREALVCHNEALIWLETYDFDRVLAMCREFDRTRREGGDLAPAVEADLESAAAPMMDGAKAALERFAADILKSNDNAEWTEFAARLGEFRAKWPEHAAWEERPKRPDKRSRAQKALAHWHDQADELFARLDKIFSKPCWDRARWREQAETWTRFGALAGEFSAQLNRLKQAQGRFEIDDLELLTRTILRDKPFLAGTFGEGWDFWMIDEYQDTSPLQAECLEALIAGKPRYLVGDPQQSIYLFRGADVGVFLKAQSAMADSSLELMRNYRSKADLLRFMNEFMGSVDASFAPMEPGGADGESGRVVCRLLRALDAGGACDAELEAVAARVGQLVAEGARLQDICILARAHSHLRETAMILKKHGYPTHLHASSGFSERREVLDAQALWTFLLNPHDNENLVALLRSPWFFVPDSRLEEWMAGRPRSLWARLESIGGAGEQAFKRLKIARGIAAEEGVFRAFERVIVDSRCLDFCLLNDPAGRKESNLWKMIDKARELEGEATRGKIELAAGDGALDPLETLEGDATSAQEPNCINLMTVHAAKGLEFEHVIVVRMGKGPRPSTYADITCERGKFFFPLKDSSGETVPSVLDLRALEELRARERAEANRTLYVAATRAKTSLTFAFSDIERDSWADRSPWFQLPAGIHSRGGFDFSVEESFAPPVQGRERTARAEIRPPWATGAAAGTAPIKQTVTGMIVEKPASRALALERFEARRRGQLIHRKLESLRFGGGAAPSDDPAVEFVLGMKDPPIRELIGQGFVEWGFQIRTRHGLLEGQIDLWGKVNGEIFVVDYKTGAPSPAKAEDAFRQLAVYGAALRRFGHAEKMWLVVLHPVHQAVEKREFTPALLRSHEIELGLAEAAGEDDFARPALDRGHGHVEGDLIGSAEPVHMGE